MPICSNVDGVVHSASHVVLRYERRSEIGSRCLGHLLGEGDPSIVDWVVLQDDTLVNIHEGVVAIGQGLAGQQAHW